MGNLFNNLQAAAYKIVSNTMGLVASWTPSTGGPIQHAVVLLNIPTQKSQITDEQYEAIRPKFEYQEMDFTRLFEAVQQNREEVILIEGIAYIAYKAERKYDGNTIIVHIELVQ